jgi:hypothetical protein
MLIDRDRLRRAVRRDRAALLVRLGAHGLGVVRALTPGRGWALRVYVEADAPGLPETITLTDDSGAFEVELRRHDGPRMTEEPA